MLTLKATRISWNEGDSGAGPYPPIRYHSGAIRAEEHVVVTNQFPNWEVKGDFQAPSARGTWPAFWLTGVNSRPPESDVLEYKGDNRNWFNTFRTWTARHSARNFTGKPLWVIINLRLEGSPGSPGPTADTVYRARNVHIGRTRA